MWWLWIYCAIILGFGTWGMTRFIRRWLEDKRYYRQYQAELRAEVEQNLMEEESE